MLLAMRVYVRVVERGNLTAAARDLGMSQSTVSERLTRLESHLGAKLLQRNTRSVATTDVGVIFYERSKKAVEAAEFAEGVIPARMVGLKGTLRVAAPNSLGEVVLPEILQRFRRLHPHLAIELVLNDRIAGPIAERADISIRLGDAHCANVIDEPLGLVRRVLVAAPDYISSHGEPKAPQDLAAHVFMRVTGLFQDGVLPLKYKGETIRAPINTMWTLATWRPLHALLLQGAGIGVLQLPAASDAIASGRLKRLMPQYEIPGFRVRLLYPDAEPIPEKTRKIAAFLKEELRFMASSEQTGRQPD